MRHPTPRRRTWFIPVLCALSLTGCAPNGASEVVSPSLIPTATASPLTERPDRIADVAEHVVTGVVHIRSTRRLTRRQLDTPFGLPFGPGQPEVQRGEGSGVLVGADGLILTNNHVVAEADALEVTLQDGRVFEATRVGTDPGTDLALVRLNGVIPDDLPTLALGDSDAVRLGEVVLAIGNPFGLSSSVSMGIVSAMGRAGVGIVDYENFIQTDAAINPGNSGGALVDLDGHVIGINTAIASRSGGYQGIGFAIPSNLARDIMDRLLKDGVVTRGWLGVGIQSVDARMSRANPDLPEKGVILTMVGPDSPAEQGGLRVGDVITEVNGEATDDVHMLRQRIAMAGADEKVRLQVHRSGRTSVMNVRLGAKPDDPRALAAATARPADAPRGVTTEALTPQLKQQLGSYAHTRGAIIVSAVEPGSRAAEAGLMTGDVILKVNETPVTSPDQFAELLASDEPVMVLVRREIGAIFVLLE